MEKGVHREEREKFFFSKNNYYVGQFIGQPYDTTETYEKLIDALRKAQGTFLYVTQVIEVDESITVYRVKNIIDFSEHLRGLFLLESSGVQLVIDAQTVVTTSAAASAHDAVLDHFWSEWEKNIKKDPNFLNFSEYWEIISKNDEFKFIWEMGYNDGLNAIEDNLVILYLTHGEIVHQQLADTQDFVSTKNDTLSSIDTINFEINSLRKSNTPKPFDTNPHQMVFDQVDIITENLQARVPVKDIFKNTSYSIVYK